MAALGRAAVAVYAAATILVAYPLLGAGYVFALDHAMGPEGARYYARHLASNANPIQSKGGYAVLLLGLDALLPNEAAQKLLLFAPFLLAGLGAHRLAPTRWAPAALFAGLFYMLSPFAYLRGVSGQTGVLWAYALAPWFLRAWWRAVDDGSRRAFAASALLLAATAVFQGHGAFLLLLLVALDALARAARSPRDVWRVAGPALALVAVSALVNAYWVAPVVFAPETTLERIGEGDRAFFAMRDDGFPSVGVAALALQGFWREGYDAYYDAPWMLAIPLALVALSVHGLRARRDARAWTVAAGGAAGLVLGVGASSVLTAPLFDLAWGHVPFFKGFRDSHKFLALLALAYAYLAPAGLEAARDALRRARMPGVSRAGPVALAALVVLAPVATATPLLHGYGGQLALSQYPAEWAEAEAATRGCDGAMLALPWHLYLDLSWVENPDPRVTNPAKLYFSCPVLSSDNVEAGTTASQSSDPRARYVEHWVRDLGEGNPRGIRTLGNLLAPVGVSHVLVLKEVDGPAVGAALAQQRDLRLVVDNARVQLYANDAFEARAWRTDVVVPLASWDELLPMSERMTLSGVVFAPPGSSLDADDAGTREPVRLAPSAMVGSLRVGETAAARHLVFTPTLGAAHLDWRLDGAPPRLLNLGVSPVYEDAGGARLDPVGAWSVAAPSWLVSLVSVVALGAWSRRDAWRAAGIQAGYS